MAQKMSTIHLLTHWMTDSQSVYIPGTIASSSENVYNTLAYTLNDWFTICLHTWNNRILIRKCLQYTCLHTEWLIHNLFTYLEQSHPHQKMSTIHLLTHWMTDSQSVYIPGTIASSSENVYNTLAYTLNDWFTICLHTWNNRILIRKCLQYTCLHTEWLIHNLFTYLEQSHPHQKMSTIHLLTHWMTDSQSVYKPGTIASSSDDDDSIPEWK